MIDRGRDAPITASDKMSDVLARDESLIAVLERHAPQFSKLHNRSLRRVMARLVTVEQAARTAKVPVRELVRDLNHALGIEPLPDAGPSPASSSIDDGVARAHPAAARVVDLDVRDDLRSGREPFSRIMSTVAALGGDDVLHLRAIFEPVPLFAVLAKRGFAHESKSHAPNDWSVWFWRPADSVDVAPEMAADAHADVPPDDATTTYLDVRRFGPPEPMMRTLAALETLPPGHTLVQINSRVPQFLLPVLAERGFACEVDGSRVDRVLVRIWRA